MSPNTKQDVATQSALTAGALANRLANTVELLTIWASALDDADSDDSALRHRLEQTAQHLDLAVEALTEVDGEIELWTPEEPVQPETPRPGLQSGRYQSIVTAAKRGVFALRGRSELVSLIEFVGFISNLHKDGMLQIQSPSEEFVLQIEQGCIVFGTGDNPSGLRLREILIEKHAASPEDLDRALDECRSDEYLGEALRRLKLIDTPTLVEALTYQVTMMFARMHAVGAGFSFQFEEGTQVLFEPDIRLGVSHLLLESARIADERSRMRSPDGESGGSQAPGYEGSEIDQFWSQVEEPTA